MSHESDASTFDGDLSDTRVALDVPISKVESQLELLLRRQVLVADDYIAKIRSKVISKEGRD